MLHRILLDPQGGEGGGAAVAETKADGGAPDLVKAVEGLISRHGDPTAALRVLMGENYTLRDRVREASARLPKDGSVVLEGDDAKHWSHYRELGRPSDLKAALGERDQFKAEAGTFRKAETVRSAAEIHGFRPSVLGTLARDLEIDFDEVKGKDGKAVRVAFVRGEGDEKTPLNEYAEARWGDFLPSLRLEAEKPRPAGTPTTPRPHAVPAGHGAAAERRAPRSTF